MCKYIVESHLDKRFLCSSDLTDRSFADRLLSNICQHSLLSEWIQIYLIKQSLCCSSIKQWYLVLKYQTIISGGPIPYFLFQLISAFISLAGQQVFHKKPAQVSTLGEFDRRKADFTIIISITIIIIIILLITIISSSSSSRGRVFPEGGDPST